MDFYFRHRPDLGSTSDCLKQISTVRINTQISKEFLRSFLRRHFTEKPLLVSLFSQAKLGYLRVEIASLSKDVFERRTSTGSESFSFFICLDANKLVLLGFFSLIKTIYSRV